MIYILLALLLSGCSALRTPYHPQYAFNKFSVPLDVASVSVTIADNTDAARDSGLARAMRTWSTKRFKAIGTQGSLRLILKTKPIAPCMPDRGLTTRKVVVDVYVQNTRHYETAHLQIELFRTNNKFGAEPLLVGSEEWATYMTDFVNTLDAQILQGLRHYAPKLFTKKPESLPEPPTVIRAY